MMCDFGYGIWQDAYNEGEENGEIKQAKKMARKLFARGDSPKEISEIVGFDLETVNKWLSEAVSV